MSSSVLEIVELENGEIVLRYVNNSADDAAGGNVAVESKAGDVVTTEPLVNIRFSEEALAFIEHSSLDVAKVMIQAGIQAAAHMEVLAGDEIDLIADHDDAEPVVVDIDSLSSHTLH